MAMPALQRMPPVVTSTGSAWNSRPAPTGTSKGTGRTKMSTTQEPQSTQSKSLAGFGFPLRSPVLLGERTWNAEQRSILPVGDDARLRDGILAVGAGRQRGGRIHRQLVDVGGELVVDG